MGLRFLNFSNHVQPKYKPAFIDNFKDLLEQLSHATSFHELGNLTQTFFKKTFYIPTQETTLFIRTQTALPHHLNAVFEKNTTKSLVENFLTRQKKRVYTTIKKEKIIIYDELKFSNFYKVDETEEKLLDFLESINADIFLPIYEKNNIIAYIIINRCSGNHKLYSHVKRDEMLVFAQYIGSMINLLQHTNVKELIHREKELKEEIYRKHQ